MHYINTVNINKIKEWLLGLGVVEYTFNPSTLEVPVGSLSSLRPASSTEQ